MNNYLDDRDQVHEDHDESEAYQQERNDEYAEMESAPSEPY